MSASFVWRIRGRQLTITRPLVMGIVNVTPDSFSDGGRYLDASAAVEHGLRLADEGADLLDVGGESTRPGSQPVSIDDELRRVVPTIAAIVGRISIPISVDTSKAEVARQAIAAGAAIVNDVTAMTGDPAMPAVVRDGGAGVILMHMRGTPATMQQAPAYPEGVLPALIAFFQSRLQELPRQGMHPESAVLDPGIGFGKTGAHNWEILARLGELGRFGRPVCLGVSRKGLFGKLLDRPVDQRLAASLAVACAAMANGSAHLLRVHDVAATRDAVRVFEKLKQFG
jgi:dihydropteroate synthase